MVFSWQAANENLEWTEYQCINCVNFPLFPRNLWSKTKIAFLFPFKLLTTVRVGNTGFVESLCSWKRWFKKIFTQSCWHRGTSLLWDIFYWGKGGYCFRIALKPPRALFRSQRTGANFFLLGSVRCHSHCIKDRFSFCHFFSEWKNVLFTSASTSKQKEIERFMNKVYCIITAAPVHCLFTCCSTNTFAQIS